MTDSPYIAYGFPSEDGETVYVPAKETETCPSCLAAVVLDQMD